jgi:hypothetical protein
VSNTNRAIPRYFLQIGIFVLLFAASLFFSAGRTDWTAGWVFMAVVAASQVSIALILMMRNPELMGERAESKGKRDLDRILAGVMALFGPISMCIVAGLNIPCVPLSFAHRVKIGHSITDLAVTRIMLNKCAIVCCQQCGS